MSRVSGRLFTYADLRYAVDNSIFRQKYAFTENTLTAVNSGAALARLHVKSSPLPSDRMPTWDDLQNSSSFSCSSTNQYLDAMTDYTWEARFDVGTTSGQINMSLSADNLYNYDVDIVYKGIVLHTFVLPMGSTGYAYSFSWTYNASSEIVVIYRAQV